MSESPSPDVMKKLVRFSIGLAVLGIIFALGLYSLGYVPVQPDTQPVPLNSATDNCAGLQNLDDANSLRFAAPTVVDINAANGNILVRGPQPLTIRDSSGSCMAPYNWKFAYDNLGGMLQSRAGYHPAYMTDDTKVAKLEDQLKSFDLRDYQLIDISLLQKTDGTEYYFSVWEESAFRKTYSTCSGPVQDSTINGQEGSLIHSEMMQCNPTDSACLQNQVFNDKIKENPHSCSLKNMVAQMDTLMKGTGASQKKRLIYYHDDLGINRVGAVTMAYLLYSNPDMSITDAQDYAQNLGDLEPDTSRVPASGWVMAAPYTALAKTYCNLGLTPHNAPRCFVNNEALPEQDSQSHLPGPGAVPEATPTTAVPTEEPAPITTPVPTQTPVPAGPYRPDTSGRF